MFREPRPEGKNWFVDQRIEIKESSTHGLGCFAKEDLPANVLIESCPVIVFHTDTLDALADQYGGRHILMEYPFQWTTGHCALCLGYGGVYNHSSLNPNVTWRPNLDLPSMEYWTRDPIAKGEELFVRYYPFSKLGLVWFPDEDADRIDGRLQANDKWEDTRLLDQQLGPYGPKNYQQKFALKNYETISDVMKKNKKKKD